MTYKVVIFGYGYWGKILHSYIQLDKRFEVICIFSRKKHNELCLSNEKDVFNKEIDIAFISLPPYMLLEYTKKCLEKKINVFCEKPLTSKVNELKSLYELADKNKVKLYLNYIYLNSPSIQFMKKNQDQIGSIYRATFEIEQYGKFYEGQNVFENIGCHMISVLFYLFIFNEVKLIAIIDEDEESKGNSMSISLKVGEISVNITASLLSQERIRRIKIIGEGGEIEFNSLETDYTVRIKNSETNIYINNKFDENNNIKNSLNTYVKIIEGKQNDNRDIVENITKLLQEIKIKINEKV